MGFYHPATLVKDAQRHGPVVCSIDGARSGWKCRWERGGVRLGMRFVLGLSEAAGKRIEEEQRREPFRDADDLARRCALKPHELTRLAQAGALASFGKTRRDALRQVAEDPRPAGAPYWEVPTDGSPPLSAMSPRAKTAAGYTAHPMTT